eukprot:5560097-Amphidinium_carterae.1
MPAPQHASAAAALGRATPARTYLAGRPLQPQEVGSYVPSDPVLTPRVWINPPAVAPLVGGEMCGASYWLLKSGQLALRSVVQHISELLYTKPCLQETVTHKRLLAQRTAREIERERERLGTGTKLMPRARVFGSDRESSRPHWKIVPTIARLLVNSVT